MLEVGNCSTRSCYLKMSSAGPSRSSFRYCFDIFNKYIKLVIIIILSSYYDKDRDREISWYVRKLRSNSNTMCVLKHMVLPHMN